MLLRWPLVLFLQSSLMVLRFFIIKDSPELNTWKNSHGYLSTLSFKHYFDVEPSDQQAH